MQTLTQTNWDVIVIGGGPAGSTAATTLAQAGRKVLLLEKAKFPRFHIGESLLPYNRKIFDELGVWGKISTAGFTRKRGAQFILGNGSRANRFDFSKGAFTGYSEALQVERAKFDDILLRHSRECGAKVCEEFQVLSHAVENDRVLVKCQTAEGSVGEIRATYLIDASGLGNFTANRDMQREYYASHRKVAIFGHLEGVKMPTGEQEGDIIIVRRENSWMWLIPISPQKTSVGLVMDAADLRKMDKPPQHVFDDAVRTTPAVKSRFTQAVMSKAVHVMTDFSYKNRRLISPRVIRVGDASGFIDPIFSSGVLLAMSSGQKGAQAIHPSSTHDKECHHSRDEAL